MARPLSSTALAAINAQSTGEAIIILLTLYHPDLEQPITVCNDAVDIVSNGITYQHFPFDITLADEKPDTPPQARLTISNVDREVIRAVRSVRGRLSVDVAAVLASQPDTIEAGVYTFVLVNIDADVSTVTGTLVYEDLFSEPCPGDDITPTTFPGVF
jgi:hypothetical protein